MTPADIFAEINRRLEADPSKVAGMNAIYNFDVQGDTGGQYHIILDNGTGTAGEGAEPHPNITITVKDEDFVAIAGGDMDPAGAFMKGKIKIKGDMGLAMKLQSLLKTG
ncbi:MAG: SCP2 sterol-binding domain-containing protein [Candidatus Dormibacteria bacterium]